MRLHVYTICWNERLMLPFFLRHYEQFAERIVVYDNGSDDGSQDMVRAHPLCELREFTSGGEFDEAKVVEIKEQVWKESRGVADWVVVCDMDEFLIHQSQRPGLGPSPDPRLRAYLADRTAKGVTISQPQGFQMVSNTFPTTDGQIYEEVRQGVLETYYSKLALFDPAAIQAMNYSPGCHFAKPAGRVVFDAEPGLLLLHFKYLGFDYLRERYRAFAARRSAAMRKLGAGFQYEWNEEELDREYKAWLGAARPLDEFERWRAEARRAKQGLRTAAPSPGVEASAPPVLHFDAWLERNAPQTPVSDAPAWLKITASGAWADWLAEEYVSLAFTSCQLGKLVVVGLKPDGQLSVFERSFPRCRGLASDGQTLWMSSLYQLWRFENALAPVDRHQGFDRLYIPRVGYTTGELDIHDVGCDSLGRPIFANARFSCVATVAERGSFTPLWKPPFISALAPEDRCHLTGLAFDAGCLRYVTLAGVSDVVQGWRAERGRGGCLIEAPGGRIVAQGLSLPHSPRLYRGRLWVLDSGTGYFGSVNRERGEFEPLTFCPGYLRGLAFAGDYALVGISRPRRERATNAQETIRLQENIAASGQEPYCGVAAIHLPSGAVAHSLRMGGMLEEIDDVVTLPGVVRPMLLGFKTDEIQRLLNVGPADEL